MLDLSEINKKNICIMGLMGSGKTIIGKDLSKYLNLNFYDTDKEIELMTKKKINEIFEEEGESYFRDIEEKVCIEILTNDNCVISLGGGSIISKKIRKTIKNNSYSIYLQVTLNNLLNRLKFSRKRPLLNNDNCVISLGGGSIISKKIRKIIKKNSYSIYLQVTLKNLLNRLKYSRKRPLLNNKSNKIEIMQKILNDRKKYYEKADLIINNNSDKFQTLNQIKSQLNIYAN